MGASLEVRREFMGSEVEFFFGYFLLSNGFHLISL